MSRPQVSDDNPVLKHCKTLKYHPGFPGRFEDITAAIAFCRSFFPWYNTEHRHAGIAMLTPDDVHHHRPDVDPSRKSGGALHRLHCFCLEFDGACEVQRRVPTDCSPAGYRTDVSAMAVSAWLLDMNTVLQISSDLMVLKKVSTTALS